MLRSAEVMHLVAWRAAEFGVEIDGTVGFRLDRAVERKDDIVRGIVKGIHSALRRRDEAIEFIEGEGRFLSAHEADIDGRSISFENAVIATGARRQTPRIPGLGSVEVLNNRTALELQSLPDRMVVVGGGYVGVEFAQMYARFGSRVTLLGRNLDLTPGEDPELSELLVGYLREEGIDVRTGLAVRELRQDGSQKIVVANEEDAPSEEFQCDEILLAIGRVGNTDSLGLSAAGIEADERGFIPVDDELRTAQPHIFAIGDVKGGWMFTHVATYDGPIAALNAVQNAGKKADYRVVPRAIFSDPTLAAVGLTEEEARTRGHDVVVGRAKVGGARAMAIGDGRGLLKAVVDAETQELLGFHLLAPQGDVLLHEAVVAMHGSGSIERISKSIHVHPTLSEMVKSAARAAR